MKKLTNSPKTSNIGWLFYKDYFRDNKGNYLYRNNATTKELIEQKTENILNQKLVKLSPLPLEEYLDMTTIYPGLLIGSGYQHEIGGVDSEFQLGFFFDYTTGMPIISGSSVKGVLRSAFKDKEYIKELLEDHDIDISKLEIEIFGSNNSDNEVEKGQDIFFDAFIIKSNNINETFLDDDYITPHHNDPYKDPIPLRFLKVSPNVTFRFYFKLHDGVITREEKLLLFDKILQDFGVGAKTNVGYGQFTSDNETRIKELIKQKRKQLDKEAEEQRIQSLSPIDKIFEINDNDVVKIIQQMQNAEIQEYASIKIELAKKVKQELQKNPKTWDRAKQKALKRKEFIESILNEV